MFAVCLALLLLAAPVFLGIQALRLPWLNDVSTDVAEPPEFSRSRAALAARNGFMHADVAPSLREAQRRAWPDIQPIIVDLEINETDRLVQNVIARLKWRVIEKHVTGGRKGRAHLDAVDASLITGLPQDIAIRLIPAAGQTRIDIRSASRVLPTDFGENARRIARFADEVQMQLDAR